jgi:hypothetical protein
VLKEMDEWMHDDSDDVIDNNPTMRKAILTMDKAHQAMTIMMENDVFSL